MARYILFAVKADGITHSKASWWEPDDGIACERLERWAPSLLREFPEVTRLELFDEDHSRVMNVERKEGCTA